jgi:pyruvate kinase
MRRNRNAKILATLGPTSSSPEVIRALFEAGADVFRLNFSHGTHADHRARYDAIRAVEREAGRPIGVLADLQGPKLRVGIFTQGRVTLEPGRPFRLDLDMAPGDERRVPLPHPEIFQALCPGAELLLDDGKIRLAVERCGTDFAETVVATGGPLSDRKGMNVPGVMLPLSALTAKDRQDLAFALELRADWIAFSFVQRPEDLDEVRELGGGGAGIVAKLEKPAAVERLDEIVARTDAPMVARGDLGVELPPEQVPTVQRMALRACRAAGKPAIMATQMLESMIEAPAPTRAEASDVATAVYEGADAVSCALRRATAILPVAATVIYTTSGASALRASGRRPRSWRSPWSRRRRGGCHSSGAST